MIVQSGTRTAAMLIKITNNNDDHNDGAELIIVERGLDDPAAAFV